MLHTFSRLIPVLACTWLLTWSCTKPTSFGEDLLQDQVADYDATYLPVVCSVEREDSVLTSDRTSSGSYFLCGQLNDPQFGITKSEIFTQITLNGTARFREAGAAYDSMVLILPYNADGFYGDSTQSYNLSVYQLADTFKRRDYYSQEFIQAGAEVGRVMGFSPRPNTRTNVITDTVNKAAYLRVKMDNAFGQSLFAIDSATMRTDASFWTRTKGLKIECTTNSTPGGMLAFNLNSTRCIMRMYYRVKDTIPLVYDYIFALSASATNGMVKFTHFTHDYTGTPAAAAMNTSNPDLLYVQGMSGLRLKVSFPNEATLQNVIINKAELQLTLAPVSTETGVLSPVSQLIMTEQDSKEDRRVVTDDIQYVLDNGGSAELGFLFGGQPYKTKPSGSSTEVQRYDLNISKTYQDIIKNPSSDPNRFLYVNVFPQSLSAQRAIFYGGNSTEFPARLRLKYTKL